MEQTPGTARTGHRWRLRAGGLQSCVCSRLRHRCGCWHFCFWSWCWRWRWFAHASPTTPIAAALTGARTLFGLGHGCHGAAIILLRLAEQRGTRAILSFHLAHLLLDAPFLWVGAYAAAAAAGVSITPRLVGMCACAPRAREHVRMCAGACGLGCAAREGAERGALRAAHWAWAREACSPEESWRMARARSGAS